MSTAIIGMGRMGQLRRHWLQSQDRATLAAICDIHPQPRGYDAPIFYFDWRELLDREKPDALFVCTYNDAIPDIVCAALEQGCHVFAEKPPGCNLHDALRMEKAAEAASGKVLKFGFNHRLHNSVLEARTMVDSGQFGQIVCARGVYGKAGAPDFAAQWRNDRGKAGGGILLDQGIHMLDLLGYFMGELRLVKSVVHNYVWHDLPMEDNALALLQTQDGRAALFHSSTTQWRHLFRLELLCEKGYIHLEGLNTSTKSYGEETVRIGYKELNPEGVRFGMPSEQIYYFDSDQSWTLEMDEFFAAVEGRAPLLHGTAADAVRVMRLVDAIYKDGAGSQG
jgi:predicted dehydrogenase